MMKEKLGIFFSKNEKAFKIILSVSLMLNLVLAILGIHSLYSSNSARNNLKGELGLKDVEIQQLQEQIQVLREEKEKSEERSEATEECKMNLEKALDFSKKKTIANRAIYFQGFISVEVPKAWCSLDMQSAFFITPKDKQIVIDLRPWVGGFPPGLDIQSKDLKTTINETKIEKKIFLEDGKYTTMYADFDIESEGKKLKVLIFFVFPGTKQEEFMQLYDKILATVKAISLEEAEEIWEQTE